MRRAPLDAGVFAQVFDGLEVAVVVLDGAGAVLACNPRARAIFGDLLDRPGATCCDLIGCGRGDATHPLAYHCVTAAVLERCRPLADLEAALPDGRLLRVTAAPLGGGAGAMLQVDAAEEASASAAEPVLSITTLGSLTLSCEGASIADGWLHHRPGELLKYLVCARGHLVPAEELVDALWPSAGRAGLINLRQAVHALRERLEPDRARQAPSRFVIARGSAYGLDTEQVVIDADAFERDANAAVLAADRAGARNAQAQLAAAARRYRGDFLPDDPYAEWALGERDRLRSLAARVLRLLAESHLQVGDLPGATAAQERLADIEPLDLANQRELISLMLRQGQHAPAARRYELVRRQFMRAFDAEPDFTLAALLQWTRPDPYAPSTDGIASIMSSPR
jgi:DNA-binding SARP family transcriptional activator